MESARHPTTEAGVRVRRAVVEDASAIADVGAAAWRATYPAILGEGPVERFVSAAYTPERIAARLARDLAFVGAVRDGHPSGVDAFIEVVEEPDRPHIVAFYARPEARGCGLGTALLAAVVAAFPGRDLSADVLVGNDLGEPFYRARGFEPGELLEEAIAGELVRERRWWLRARHSAG